VTTDHCRKSNAGLYYRNGDEFVESLDLLVREGDLRRAMGENGRRYVDGHYRWDGVLARYRRLIEAVARQPRPPARAR
jgi:glycosyltransferase involved in cell wall biosynthesis